VIGPPVSITLSPRAQAVGGVHGDRADAVVAEVLLHLADHSSSVRLSSGGISILSAVKISGMWSGKTTSMTTPVTCSTVPTLFPLSAIRLLLFKLVS